jgi:poly(3-hydroxybutyrate) depolymerase
MEAEPQTRTAQLGSYTVQAGGNSISGLSSGAFMTVQLQLAHSASFIGAGVIAGGPYRCVESFREAAASAEDAYILNAEYICMAPLTPSTGPDAKRLAALARQTAEAGKIDPVDNLQAQRVYIFTGARDTVVHSSVVRATRDFYEALGVPPRHIAFIDTLPAGHCIFTDNPDDQALDANQPPYINRGDRMQSHDILGHIYQDLEPPAATPAGDLLRFDQTEFVDGPFGRSSMGKVGWVYVPRAVADGEPARGVHIVLHGCKQGHAYVDYLNGRPAIHEQPPYGARYITGTGYNEMAESNRLIVLYPQATGDDGGAVQNPDGCWDWWGYTAADVDAPDYYSKDAVQIRALHAMLDRVRGVA